MADKTTLIFDLTQFINSKCFRNVFKNAASRVLGLPFLVLVYVILCQMSRSDLGWAFVLMNFVDFHFTLNFLL